MRYDKRYDTGSRILAEKDGEIIEGKIIEVKAEMTYEIELKDGSLRSVDHSHIEKVYAHD